MKTWEAISHKVSTLVEDSVGSLTDRLTELEHTVQSQRTTPPENYSCHRGGCLEHGNVVNSRTGDLVRVR